MLSVSPIPKCPYHSLFKMGLLLSLVLAVACPLFLIRLYAVVRDLSVRRFESEKFYDFQFLESLSQKNGKKSYIFRVYIYSNESYAEILTLDFFSFYAEIPVHIVPPARTPKLTELGVANQKDR